jgi:hypothetical protein
VVLVALMVAGVVVAARPPDTWSAGKDSGTGCNVGVLIILLLLLGVLDEEVIEAVVSPEDMAL